MKMSILFILFVITQCFFTISCKEEPVNPVDYSYEDFSEIWSTTNQYYPFFEFKKLNWDSVYTIYEQKFNDVSDDEKIILLGQLLNELKDGHANLFDKSGNPLSFYKTPRAIKDENSFSYQLVKKYFSTDLKITEEVFRYEILSGNIGYLYITSFPQDIQVYKKFDLVLNYLKETKGLIIDIRHNGGGSTNASDYFISRLISEELKGSLWTKRNGVYLPVNYFYPSGDYQYTKPSVLLINGKSFSTSEAMANLCKKVGHISLIGDTTGGGGGVPDEMFRLPSGLQFRVPTRCIMRFDGEQIEWNGIPPDIVIPQTKFDIDNNQDKQLEYAIKYLQK